MRLPPNYGSVYKLSGNRRKPWAVRIHKGKTEEGRPIREIIGYYAGQKEALQSLAEYHSAPEAFANKKITFADVYEAVMPEHNEGKSEALMRVYRAAFRSLSPLHPMIFDEIRAYHIEEIIKNMEGSASKKRHMVTLLSIMYKYALKMEISTVDRSKNINIGKVKDAKEQKVYPELEIKRLWKDKGNLVAETLLILIYSGMRVSELLKMEKKDVYIADSYMVGGSKSTAGKQRIRPIHHSILHLVAKYNQKGNKYLLEDEEGERFKYSDFKRAFTLPETVNEDAIGAQYKDGILRFSLPKKKEALPKPKRLIEVGK